MAHRTSSSSNLVLTANRYLRPEYMAIGNILYEVSKHKHHASLVICYRVTHFT